MPTRFLVAVDFSELTERTVAYAVKLAAGTDTRIDLFHVVVGTPPAPAMGHPAAREIMDQLAAQERKTALQTLTDLMNTHVPEAHRGEILLEEGPAADLICEKAAGGDYELVAVSTHGRTGLKFGGG